MGSFDSDCTSEAYIPYKQQISENKKINGFSNIIFVSMEPMLSLRKLFGRRKSAKIEKAEFDFGNGEFDVQHESEGLTLNKKKILLYLLPVVIIFAIILTA